MADRAATRMLGQEGQGIRISAAFALLRQGTQPLAGIALDLGFASQSHSPPFTGLTGISPDQFRRLHRRTVG
jgi:AraC-like DNA-binding protein